MTSVLVYLLTYSLSTIRTQTLKPVYLAPAKRREGNDYANKSNTECGIKRPTNAIYMGSHSLLGSKLSGSVKISRYTY